MDFEVGEDDEHDEREDKFSAQGFLPPLKESIVFLVDAQDSMLERAGVEDLEGYDPDDTWLEIALKIIKGLFKEHIICSPSDSLALVFFGTRDTQNASGIDNVYVYQELDQPTAHSVRELDQLLGEGFDKHVGSSDSTSGDAFFNALWIAHTLLSKAPRALKRTLIFTRSEDPTGGNTTKRNQILARVEQMKAIQAELDPYPMVLHEEFDYKPFWAEVLGSDGLEASEAQLPNRLQALDVTVRQRAYKRRVLCRSSLTFRDGFSIAVSLYALLQPAVKSSYQWVHRRDLEPLRSETALICADTGAMLTDVTKLTFPNVDPQKQPRIPRLIISKDDMQTLKQTAIPGLRLLGFKPLAALRDFHQVRNPSFLYPDEALQSGATTAFVALHECLLEGECFALCSFIRTRAAEPQLVALLPQQELRDSYGNQMEPPGMNLIYLPYADDIRGPESDPSFVGSSSERASTEQVKLACAVMDQLMLPDFSCYNIANPVLQRHFQALEALALSEPVPEEIQDDTRPDVEGMQSASAAVNAFKDAVYGPGYDESAGPSRKPAGATKRKPDAAAGAAASGIDYRGLASEGQLATLTVEELKLYCSANGLVKGGKKADIIARIAQHLDG